VEKVVEEADWAEYFAKIKGVCPWSYRAHMADNILFLDYNEPELATWSSLFHSSKYEAFVYKCPGKSSDWLNSKCDQLNQTDQKSEWLWSHPTEGGDSTPIPVLIQQDKVQLAELREKLGYEDD